MESGGEEGIEERSEAGRKVCRTCKKEMGGWMVDDGWVDGRTDGWG